MLADPGGKDLARAVAELAERLPPAIAALARIAYNYRWTWLPGGAGLFRDIDASLWRRCGFNPRWIIEAVPPHRLRELAADAQYARRVARVAAALDADLARPAAPGAVSSERPVVYFCSEFGGHCSLPLYGGGLGVLAGDLVKAASDLALPLVCVSLFYRQGYFHQRLDHRGRQVEYWTTTDFERLPAVLVTSDEGRPLALPLELRGRTVQIQIWRVDFGRVPVYLLDTDRPDNHPIDRWMTARLYVGDRHTRLAQYATLGCGGVRALAALGIEPGLVHLNEGHAALGGFERLAARMAGGETFDEALVKVRAQTVFTTHTPVAAGNEWFSPEEVEPVLGALRERLGVPAAAFYGLGRLHPGGEQEAVALTPLALRTSRAANAVSKRHGEVSRAMWQPLWPDRSAQDVPIGSVTNGVHTTTWMAAPMQALLDRHLPADWRQRTSEPGVWDAVSSIPDAELWQVRQTLRQHLVEEARERSVGMRLSRAEPPDYVDAAMRIFDADSLTIGFARRVATYKRLHLLTYQLERGLRLLADPKRAIQLVIAGKAHPADDEAKATLRRLLDFRRAPNVAGRIVFLEDYDLHLAPWIVAGVDLWLNLPRPPFEASGTSGMKVVVNGGLNLSVLDGWWAEAYDGQSGWAIASGDGDPHAQDEIDAAAVFNLLEAEVIPLFHERNAAGIPERWIARVKSSMRRLVPRFSAERMMREYAETMYAVRDA
ncbi:MAG: alpha-glucan family phosphorylase [Deltaproteobacteria bacterium]|nr:alpha-glucan family phosphorylase [Deltaproteobacteria bacterium]